MAIVAGHYRSLSLFFTYFSKRDKLIPLKINEWDYLENLIMQAAKQDALNTINQLPDNADMEEIMYRLYVLDKIRKGQEAVEQGRTLTSEELQREIDSW